MGCGVIRHVIFKHARSRRDAPQEIDGDLPDIEFRRGVGPATSLPAPHVAPNDFSRFEHTRRAGHQGRSRRRRLPRSAEQQCVPPHHCGQSGEKAGQAIELQSSLTRHAAAPRPAPRSRRTGESTPSPSPGGSTCRQKTVRQATATNLRMLRTSCSVVCGRDRSNGRNDPWL